MERERQDPRNTREFVAMWNEAKEEHLVQRLDEVLDGLSRRGALPALSATQRDMLAHALQLAGDPGAGPAAALSYLESFAVRASANPPGV
ncbi:MAG TPA: hypothetical protein VEB59_11450 [Gemmatimonadales bacterium]|nr:hypothetical protein [Gemmatimonadales bacterium]